METGACANKILKAELQHPCDKPLIEVVQLRLAGSAVCVLYLQPSTGMNEILADKSKTTITYTSEVLCTDVQEL